MTLTRETILNMPAGRELDFLTLELVLGYRWVYYELESRKGKFVRYLIHPAEVDSVTMGLTKLWEAGVSPDAEPMAAHNIRPYPYRPDTPSTDMTAAWPLMAKLPGWVLQQCEDGTIALFPNDRAFEDYIWAVAGPAPETICRAALLTTLPVA